MQKWSHRLILHNWAPFLKLVYKLTQDIFLRLYVVIVHWEQENVFPGVAEKVKVFNLFLTWQVWQPSVWRCYKGFRSASPTVQGVQDADHLSKEQFIFSDQSLWTNAFSSKPCWNLGLYGKWGLGISTKPGHQKISKEAMNMNSSLMLGKKSSYFWELGTFQILRGHIWDTNYKGC